QSGQSRMAEALVRKHPKPTAEDMDQPMFQGLCRCGTYPRINRAIRRASGRATTTETPSKPAAVPAAPFRRPIGPWLHTQEAPGIKLAKKTKNKEADAAHVSAGMGLGTFYRTAGQPGHLARGTVNAAENVVQYLASHATSVQSADGPTAQAQAAQLTPNCWV